MPDLKNELQSFEGEEFDEGHKRKAIDALKRMESWNLFSDTYEEFQNYTVARDSFLAHLGATLWGSMRHIISPSIADGAFHYFEKISFQLFFITQEKVRNIKQLPVDLKAVMDGLSSLLLPSQKPVFSHHMLNAGFAISFELDIVTRFTDLLKVYRLPLSEDPALAMDLSVARRAAAVPLLLVNGTYRKTTRACLDSSILQYQLQRLNEHGSLNGLIFFEMIICLNISVTDFLSLAQPWSNILLGVRS
ncbi:Transmembrane protein [Quillaja saponaria]|uniref:Transmembrane protein n=1 Tax=Quillaja saponaria TaxID=32244 RepID=A0AAD7PCQ9_QUISA|nr:Transmembrane protein [Quillaja saponaria]